MTTEKNLPQSTSGAQQQQMMGGAAELVQFDCVRFQIHKINIQPGIPWQNILERARQRLTTTIKKT